MGAHSCGRLGDLTRSQLIRIIDEAAVGEIDSYICRRYLIDRVPHIEIAGEIEAIYGKRMDRSGVSRRWQRAKKKIENTHLV